MEGCVCEAVNACRGGCERPSDETHPAAALLHRWKRDAEGAVLRTPQTVIKRRRQRLTPSRVTLSSTITPPGAPCVSTQA